MEKIRQVLTLWSCLKKKTWKTHWINSWGEKTHKHCDSRYFEKKMLETTHWFKSWGKGTMHLWLQLLKKETFRHHSQIFLHNGEKTHQCIICDMKQHFQSVREEKKPDKCSACDYSLSRKEHLKRHNESIHEGKKPHKCSRCGYRCSAKSTFRQN